MDLQLKEIFKKQMCLWVLLSNKNTGKQLSKKPAPNFLAALSFVQQGIRI